MNNLLKAMGFWIWGLIAIGLSRVDGIAQLQGMLSVYRQHGIAVARTAQIAAFMPMT